MRNIVLLASAVLLLACESPTTPAARSLQVGVAPRAAVIPNERFQIVSAAINDCNGDYVPGVFQLPYLLGVTFDSPRGPPFNLPTDIHGPFTNDMPGCTH